MADSEITVHGLRYALEQMRLQFIEALTDLDIEINSLCLALVNPGPLEHDRLATLRNRAIRHQFSENYHQRISSIEMLLAKAATVDQNSPDKKVQ